MKQNRMVWMLLVGAMVFGVACAPSEQEKAQQHYQNAVQMAQEGQFNAARIEIDSIHQRYPQQVAFRRLGKRLCDSITAIEAERTFAYADSVHALLLPKADSLLRFFRYEKNEKYEDEGKYVHRLLNTGSNTARCYLQAYVTDQRTPVLKSYYFGIKALEQSAVVLSVGDLELKVEGKNHAFQSEGWHEILSLDEEPTFAVLQFIDAHQNDRVKVKLMGKSDYTYYLQANEREALSQTYELALVMRDIRQAEVSMKQADYQIGKWKAQQTML